MQLPQYVVDAFTSRQFRGNPAAVCLLDHALPDALLQDIAAENNLSETAFLLPQGDDWALRWFTPRVEIPLCGHATLASAFVLALLQPQSERFRFHTLSGQLEVTRDGERFTLDFPARAPAHEPAAADIARTLDLPRHTVLRSGSTLLLLLPDEASVLQYRPDFAAISGLDCRGLIITARGSGCDFVSRFFAPAMGIDEDPVTGSAHCVLVPFWAGELGKTSLHARQLSERGGELFCELAGDRVLMSGQGVLFARGEIFVTPTKD